MKHMKYCSRASDKVSYDCNVLILIGRPGIFFQESYHHDQLYVKMSTSNELHLKLHKNISGTRLYFSGTLPTPTFHADFEIHMRSYYTSDSWLEVIFKKIQVARNENKALDEMYHKSSFALRIKKVRSAVFFHHVLIQFSFERRVNLVVHELHLP